MMGYKYLMSVVEAAKYFNIGRDKLYALVRSEPDLPVLKIGDIVKINVPMMEQFINKCTEEGREL